MPSRHETNPTPPAAPLYLAFEDAGVRTGLSARTIRRAYLAGELTGYRFGRALRVRLDDLDRWAESKAVPNPRTLKPVKAGTR